MEKYIDWNREINDKNRFQFGKNWNKYLSKKYSDTQRVWAKTKLKESLGKAGLSSLADKSFLDIGCGSGIHSLAALDLLASSVDLLDFDDDSVNCARNIFSRLNIPHAVYSISQFNILSPDTQLVPLNSFDVVYSWGVLHHTGNTRLAIKNASLFCKPGGILFISIYYPTFLDFFWKVEKKLYNKLPSIGKRFLKELFVLKTRISFFFKRKSFSDMTSQYYLNRGMDYFVNVDDWLGGYPYDPMSTSDCVQFVESLGFNCLYSESRGSFFSFSSGCNEMIFRQSA